MKFTCLKSYCKNTFPFFVVKLRKLPTKCKQFWLLFLTFLTNQGGDRQAVRDVRTAPFLMSLPQGSQPHGACSQQSCLKTFMSERIQQKQHVQDFLPSGISDITLPLRLQKHCCTNSSHAFVKKRQLQAKRLLQRQQRQPAGCHVGYQFWGIGLAAGGP